MASEKGRDIAILRLWIDRRLEDVALIGYAVRGVCRGKGMSAKDADDVELAVCESVNNVVRHGHACRSGENVEVMVRAEERQLAVEIMDCAGPDEPIEPQEPASVDCLPEGGLGLYIIHSLMDRVEHLEHAGRIVLRMTKQYR
ncbi:MAG: ATP-binding protein [Candidatus Desulfacyla sp.]